MKDVWILDRNAESAAELTEALPRLMYETSVWTDADRLIAALDEKRPDVVVIEHCLSEGGAVDTLRAVKEFDRRLPVVVVAATTSSQGAIESMREGAYDYLPRGTLPSGLEDAVRRALSPDGGMIRTIGSPGPGDVAELGAIVGRTPEMVEIHKLIGQTAATDAAVLIQGESGTGKELIARAIHYNSDRRNRPFVAVNCGAMHPEALDAELFGGRRPGSSEWEPGRFEQANEGTIFLDEVDTASLPVQGRILSVLENGQFERPGARTRVKVNVRVVAATGRSLVAQMKEGTFRVDLFYRLKVVSIFIPPLRDRRDDIPYLAEYFLERAKSKLQKDVDGISQQVFDLLADYPWPGNVRELERSILRAVALNRTGVLVPEDFEIFREGAESWPDAAELSPEGLESAVSRSFRRLADRDEDRIDDAIVSEVERVLAEEAMRHAGGNQVRAARLLGISRNTLRKRLREG
ncbi:MAG: AAA domain-containing protein [Candidatus Eisenbacteria bacterium]|nr:AAA domain-containing protein [Candidatus Eisenbacteria bacterium]